MRVKRSVLERLEDFRAWGRTGAAPGAAPITLLDYVGFVALPDSVFAFAELFFPELVEHEGRKYLASRFSSAAYDAWIEARAQRGGDAAPDESSARLLADSKPTDR